MNKISSLCFGGFAIVAIGMNQSCADREPSDNGGKGAILDGGAGGGTGQGDSGGVTGSRSADTPLGKACVNDRDCGGTLKCLSADTNDFIGGGPAHGICTLECTDDFYAGDAAVGTVCRREIAGDAICLGVSASRIVKGKAYCIAPCNPGPGVGSKCHGRDDMACRQPDATNDPGFAYCTPMCRNDADCGSRKCDLRTGVCVDAANISGTVPLGAPCDAGAEMDPCNGICVPIDFDTDAGLHGPGYCAAFCELGQIGCGSDTKTITAACIFGSGDIGDEGLCGQLCNCNDECVEGRVCRAFSSAAERTQLQHRGYCGGAKDSMTGAAVPGIACTTTPKDAGGGSTDAGGTTDAVAPTPSDASGGD